MKNIDLDLLNKINTHFQHFDQTFLQSKPCRISSNEVLEKIKKGEKILFLDIRTEYETSLVGYTFKNTINIPLNNLFEKDNIHKLLDYKNHLIIVSCHSGARTIVATAFLNLLGITNVKSLEGGIADFAEKVKP